MSPSGVTKEFQQQPNGRSNGSGPPTGEVGSLTPYTPALPGWNQYVGDDLERSPQLQWPQSVVTYSQMRHDAQIQGLYLGTTLPLRRYRWSLDDNGCDPQKVKKLAADLNLSIAGQESSQQLRSKHRFSFKKHLETALLALLYGHYPFEQVGEIDKEDGLWCLKRLAPRPPETLSSIELDATGELTGFTQYYASGIGTNPKPISADRAVWYSWMMEGANWPGRSMLRACYRNWLRKDRLLRVDAQKQERNGMGIPIAEAPAGIGPAAHTRLERLMRRLRAGDTSGGAVPAGTKVTLTGTTGTLPDTIASIRLDNEEMARAWLAMFMQLGQTETGSRALGSEFIDFFSEAIDEMAAWFCDTFTEHVIEDWWDWNVGEGEEFAPRLRYTRNPDSAWVGRDVAQLVQRGAITLDVELENAIRARYGLPMREESDPAPANPQPADWQPWEGEDTVPVVPTSPGTTQPSTPAADGTQARRGRPARAASSPLSLPGRPLRRQPYEHEIQASVDWASMDSSWQLARDRLVKQVSAAQLRQIDELHDQIVEAGNDLSKLSAIQATPNMEGIILVAMGEVAAQGARDAQAEALRQGASPALPDLASLAESQKNRAGIIDLMLARSLSASAQTTAMRLAGGSLAGADIASGTKTKLLGLSDAYLKDNLGGALTVAMNSGRRATMGNGNPTAIYASELLDDNTCVPCIAEDGTQFVTLDDAERDYSSGGFNECLGGGRCRGTLVAVYGDESVATLE